MSKTISYDDIEKLSEDVKTFIEEKGFDILDSFEFLTRLEKVLYEGIDKHFDEDDFKSPVDPYGSIKNLNHTKNSM